MAWEYTCPVRDSAATKVVQRDRLNARKLGDSPESSTEIVRGQPPFFPLAGVLLLLHPYHPSRRYKYHLGAEPRLDMQGPESFHHYIGDRNRPGVVALRMSDRNTRLSLLRYGPDCSLIPVGVRPGQVYGLGSSHARSVAKCDKRLPPERVEGPAARFPKPCELLLRDESIIRIRQLYPPKHDRPRDHHCGPVNAVCKRA